MSGRHIVLLAVCGLALASASCASRWHHDLTVHPTGKLELELRSDASPARAPRIWIDGQLIGHARYARRAEAATIWKKTLVLPSGPHQVGVMTPSFGFREFAITVLGEPNVQMLQLEVRDPPRPLPPRGLKALPEWVFVLGSDPPEAPEADDSP